MTGRLPPHDLAAEEALLGTMLMSKGAAEVGLDMVGPADFYKPAHGHVHDAVAFLRTAGEAVDTSTVAGRLRAVGLFDDIGGESFLIGLLAGAPSPSAASRHARVVADLALLRRLQGAAGEIAEMAHDTTSDEAGVALDRAQALLFELARSRVATEAVAVGAALPRWLEDLETAAAGDGLPGLPTGWADLDNHLLGLHPGQLVTIAARPSIGKSAVALALAAQVAETTGKRALLFSAEMSLRDLLTRMVSRRARVDSQRIRSGQMADRDLQRISGAVSSMITLPVEIVDDAGPSLMSIRALARRKAGQPAGLGVVLVDYLQLLVGAGRPENRQVEVAELARGLKRLAGELQVPIVALAQLNRSLEARADKRPTLADLRESGEIENASDVVIGLYRDEVYYSDSPDRGVMEMIVLKQRNGPIGTARVAYQAEWGTVSNMARAV